MRIQVTPIANLSEKIKTELKARTDREFSHVEIVRSHVWSQPDWIFLGYEGDQLVSFLNVVKRQGIADNQPVCLFGLNNVITEPDFRKRGYSRKLNQTALSFMKNKDNHAFGLLFCADDLVQFYGNFGWKRYAGRVIVQQPSGDKDWPSNCMIYPLDPSQKGNFQLIHLCGLPW